MSKKGNIAQSKKQTTVLLIAIATVLSSVHLIDGPTDSMGLYLSLFVLLYFIVIVICIALAVSLKSGWRILAIANCVVAILLLAYDIFGISLGAMQF